MARHLFSEGWHGFVEGRGWSLIGLLGVACGLIPLSASAQQGHGASSLSVDAARVRECFVQMGQEGVGNCIAEAANLCQERDGGSTTLGIVACLQAETEVWDDLLNAQYLELRDSMRQQDQEWPELGISRAEALRDVQRAWIAFRDAECGYAYARYQGGTIRNVVAASCVLEETARRALTLKAFLHEGNM